MKKEIFGYGICISKIFDIDLQFEDFQNEKVDDFLKNIKNYCIKNRIDIYLNFEGEYMKGLCFFRKFDS